MLARTIALVIAALLVNNAVKATKYVSPVLVVRATRKRYGRKILDANRHSVEIVVKVGKPNYLEREFISICKKVKEPFPVRKIQLNLYNASKTKLKRK